jgi:hypothetical protein
MTATDLKKGSIVEIKLFYSEVGEKGVQVKIERVSNHYLWYKYTGTQRVGLSTFQRCLDTNYYKIISL